MSCSWPFVFILNIETDVIPGDSAERCTSCQRRGSKTQDQDENLSKVCCCLFIFWLCKSSSHLTKNNTCLQSNINDCTFSACLNAWRASEQKPNTAFIHFPAAAAWMCCCRAREPRWSPWSQTWASVRRRWSSSPSTASPSRSKIRILMLLLFRGLASLPLSTTSLFYCFLLLLKRVR